MLAAKNSTYRQLAWLPSAAMTVGNTLYKVSAYVCAFRLMVDIDRLEPMFAIHRSQPAWAH